VSGTDDPGHPEEQVGSISEEAAKLLGALAGWAGEQEAEATGLGGPATPGLSGLAARAARAVREADQHLATGDAECTWCPICRTVHAVRRTSPEVRAHLATAASSLLQAAAGLLATAVPPEARADGRGHGVERIDLDADDDHPQGADEAPSEEDEQ
jgi:hypothetical protein